MQPVLTDNRVERTFMKSASKIRDTGIMPKQILPYQQIYRFLAQKRFLGEI